MAINPTNQIPGGVTDVNEAFFDSVIRHQIFLLRMSGSIRNDINDLLNKTEEDIARQIRDRLRTVKGISPTNLKKLETLQKIIRNIRTEAWDEVDKLWERELIELAKKEPEFINAAVRTVSPAVLDTVTPSAELLRSIVTTRPFEGRTLKQWAKDIRRADLQRIEDQIKIGVVQGETNNAIARRVVGTARLQGSNGVTEITRQQAAGITRTAVISISNQAKREFFTANADLFDEELYVATLDSRTTPICRSLDGKTFPVGEGPIPPLHFNCRSVRVAVLDGQAIGRRPAKPTTERQLLREFTKKEGLKSVTSRAQLPRGTKGAFDRFSTQRVRDLTGQVPAKVNYQQWLGRQSAAFQDDVLGKTRGRLFRRGKLQLDKFVNRSGDEIPLRELAKTNKQAFIDAGLDPEDFLS